MYFIRTRHLLIICTVFLVIAALGMVGILAIVPASSRSEGDSNLLETWVPIRPEPGLTPFMEPPPAPHITADSAILIEAETGKILFAKNEHKKRPIASTTKILTGLIAIEEGDLDSTVTVSQRAASTRGSTARLSSGQEMPLRELLYGMFLNSGNDAAVAVAEHISGSVEAFAEKMNGRAAELGAVDSRFRNPHGLDAPGHYSTAFDLAVISRSALLSPTFTEYVSTKNHAVPWAQTSYWNNTNRLLWSFDGAEGVKTGTTSGAGNCLVAAATRNGMRLISVVLNSRDRWTDSQALLDYGFEHYQLADPAPYGQTVAQVPIHDGLPERVSAVPVRPTPLVLTDEQIRLLNVEMKLVEMRAPIAGGDPLGTLYIRSAGEELAQISLVAAGDVSRRTPWRLFFHWVRDRFDQSPT